MRLGYLEPFAGVSGDMLLGAFVHAGVSADLLHESAAQLKLGATLDIREVTRGGLRGVKVNVLVDGHPAESAPHEPAHAHHHHDHDEQAHAHHDGPHHHEAPARHLREIRALIEAAAVPKPAKATALRAFELLGEAEAKMHGVPIEAVHFHEVGAVDSIMDIVLAAVAAHALEIEAWHCAALNVGSGTFTCAHGRLPIPAPATAELLRGAPTYAIGADMEMVTPTGAALVRAFGCTFDRPPAMRVEKIGYGAGTRDPHGFANVLRLSIGETGSGDAPTAETVTVIETAVDDLNPQVIAYVTEQALKLGALDAMCTPVQMKKNRSGILITLLSDAAHVAALQDLLLRETSTLGLRLHEERRVCLAREHVSVATPWGAVRVKQGRRGAGEELSATPEFEDCRKIAESHAVPLKRVMETAMQAYRGVCG